MPNGVNAVLPRRIDFSKIPSAIQIPNLIEVQKRSYERFLQMSSLPSERDDFGLQAVFNSVFPITDFRGVAQLDFVDYSIGDWECKCGSLRGLHHCAAPETVRLYRGDGPFQGRRGSVPEVRNIQQERS